jgi:hypothetical protein
MSLVWPLTGTRMISSAIIRATNSPFFAEHVVLSCIIGIRIFAIPRGTQHTLGPFFAQRWVLCVQS